MTGILLTTAELKGYIQDTAESDTTLQQRIDDTEEELNHRFGRLELDDDAIATITERVEIRGYRTALPLSQAADEVISIKADGSSDALATSYYRLRGDRDVIYAAAAEWGGIPAAWPYNYIDIEYRPADSRARRRRALIKLIQLDMNYQPGMGGQSGGPWSESYTGQSYDAQREAIFATVDDQDLFA